MEPAKNSLKTEISSTQGATQEPILQGSDFVVAQQILKNYSKIVQDSIKTKQDCTWVSKRVKEVQQRYRKSHKGFLGFLRKIANVVSNHFEGLGARTTEDLLEDVLQTLKETSEKLPEELTKKKITVQEPLSPSVTVEDGTPTEDVQTTSVASPTVVEEVVKEVPVEVQPSQKEILKQPGAKSQPKTVPFRLPEKEPKPEPKVSETTREHVHQAALRLQSAQPRKSQKKLEELFFAACKKGNLLEVQKILQENKLKVEEWGQKKQGGRTAVEHAYYSKNRELFLFLLGNQASAEIKGINYTRGSATNTYDAVSAVDLEAFTKRALQGRNTELRRISIDIFNSDWSKISLFKFFNKKGLLDQKIEQTIQIIKSHLQNSGCLVLHMAILEGNVEKVKQILAFNPNLFAKDMDGRVPMHYAAVQKNSEILQLLLAHQNNGIQSTTHDCPVAPLELIGEKAERMDPLGISRPEMMMFVATLTSWVAQAAVEYEVIPQEYQSAISWTIFGASTLSQFSEFFMGNQGISTVWKRGLVSGAWMLAGKVPILRTGVAALSTSRVALSGWQGCKDVYQNIAYRPFQATKKLAVHTVNTAASVQRLASVVYQDADLLYRAATEYNLQGIHQKTGLRKEAHKNEKSSRYSSLPSRSSR